VSARINILYIIDYFHGTGGTERHLSYLVGHLPAEKFNCSIAVFDLAPNRWVDNIRAGGIPVIHVPVAREYAPGAIPRAIELARMIRSKNVHIVQTFHQKSDTYGAVIASLAGIKHIVSSKRDTGELKKARHYFLNRRLRRLFERVIVVADAVGEIVVAKEGIDRSRVVRIYNGVDAVEFAPPSQSERIQEKQRLGFAPEDFVVGMAARVTPAKNYDVFLAGALHAATAIPSLKILAVGGGPNLEEFRERYAKEARESRVVFAGDVRDVARHLRAMDVGCLIPGKNEGFSNSVLEKMAVGLPLVVSDVGGNREAVIHGQNGLVVPPGDLGAFRRALIDIHADPARRLRMGQTSREFVEEKFTLQRMCKSHESLYLSLVSRPSSPS
jgi:L-malate glycosyltransferase